MIEPLKPCPFCGGKAEIWHVPRSALWSVSCSECDSFGRYRPTEGDAIKYWNHRSAETNLLTATEAWIDAMDRWLEGYPPKTPEESQEIYDAAVAAVRKARGEV